MALTQFTKDMNIIAALSDDPNVTDGLTAAQLKAKFDEGGLAVKTYLNGTLKTFVDGLQSGTGFPDGAISVAKISGAQKQIAVLTGTAGSNNSSNAWTKHSLSVSGTTKYYHTITINVSEATLSSSPALAALFTADHIIVRPSIGKVLPLDSDGLANLVNCSGVQFSVAGVEASGGRYIMTIVAYGWGNAAGKKVVLDLIGVDDSLDSSVAFITEGMTPVPN